MKSWGECERVFTRSDTEMLRAVTALLDRRIADPEVLLQLTRVTGQSLGRLAEAQVSATAGHLRDVNDGGSPAVFRVRANGWGARHTTAPEPIG